MYSLHDVEVIGLSLTELLECEIESRIGEHSTLVLVARVAGEEDFLYELPDCQNVEVLLHEGKEKKLLFSGIVTEIQVSETGQMKTVRIEGKSRSWLMDRTRRSRSFQNVRMSYRELVEEILKNYEDEDNDLICTVEDQRIQSLIVQYEETDWAFLQRALSLAGLALTPDSRRTGLKLYAGVPSLAETGLSYHVLEMDKDMDTYYGLKANDRRVQASDFTRYRVSSEQLLGIFEPVAIRGTSLVAYACLYSFETQELTGIYGLQSPEGLIKAASYPMHLIGVALTGKVINVSGTKIQAALEIDGAHTERAVHWFPYSTLSASADGSGWYCMPEKGDEVRIYFPSKQEAEAIALSAVSSYNAPTDGGKDRMSDPNSRYLRTRDGQELALTPDYMRLSCGQDAASVTIQEDGRVTVRAKAMVRATAQEEMLLYAGEELSVHASEQFILHGLSGGQILSGQGSVALYGTGVNFD